ncbi:hypothetical protein P8971_24995 [Serratia marcescens]|uniref:hypothetical protein n=1 Tax=Serratia marcescens TaxID=615 RepID=UPI0032048FD8
MSDFADFERKAKNEPRHDEDAEVAHFSGAQAALAPPNGGAPGDNGAERLSVEQHIITHLNAHLPELYEFFLLSENERYIRVGDLRALQQAIGRILSDIMTRQDTLPEGVVVTLSSLRLRNNAAWKFNAFGDFLGAYIRFREQHGYGENSPLPRILLEANKQKQGAVDRDYQWVAQTNLLASRLSGYLAQTFELLEHATRMNLRPWHERAINA